MSNKNDIDKLVIICEENRKTKCWTSRNRCDFGGYCDSEYDHRYTPLHPENHFCSNHVAILVDTTKWDEPPCVVIENRKNEIGWITLKNNINIFCWCSCNDDIEVAKSLKHSLYKQNIIRPSSNTHWVTIDMKKYRKKQTKNDYESDSEDEYEEFIQIQKPPDQKTHRIRTTSIICKPNEPPSLFLLCKIAYLTRYMVNSKNAEYLSSHFLLHNENVPHSLDLNLVTMRALHLISNWTL